MNKKDILLLTGAVVLIGSGAFSMVVRSAGRSAEFLRNTFTSGSSDKIVSDTVDLSKFTRLKVDVASVNTYVEIGDSYKLEYRVYEKNVPIVNQSGEKLSVEQPSSFSINFINPIKLAKSDEQYYKLTVPKDAGVLDVNMDASSGKMVVDGVDVRGTIELSSGKAEVNNISSDELYLGASSGKISVKNTEVEKLRVGLTSGKFEADDCAARELEAQLTSGKMAFDSFKVDKADFDITSGSVNLNAVGKEEDYSYDLDATTGTIKVNGRKVDDNYRKDAAKNKEIKAELTSGNLNISFSD